MLNDSIPTPAHRRTAMMLLAAQSPGTAAPARGAPLGDLVTLTIVFAVAGLLLLAVSVGHRKKRFPLLQRLGGFPLDDIWHRLFGQDVTLWGPTHIQMIGGASLATLAMWVLAVEGERAAAAAGKPVNPKAMLRIHISLAGAFLIGMSTLQAEFDFGVPQFNQLFHPTMIMLAAGIALVAARIRLGKGGAIAAVGFFLLFRGALTLIIGPILGRTLLHFPLYLAEAAVIE